MGLGFGGSFGGSYTRPPGGSPAFSGGFTYRQAVAAAAVGLLYDFTSKAGVTASGVVVTRSGATVYPMLSASTCEAVGNNLPVWEDRGDAEGGGLWTWDTYTNAIADPFDFSTGWTQDGGITYTANVAIGPDGGATNVDRVRDNSAVADQRVYRAGASALQACSVWVRDVSGDAPSAAGQLSDQASAGNVNVTLGSGTAWRRIRNRGSSGVLSTHIAIFPSTLGGTGAVELWGAQRVSGTIPRWFYLPLAMGGSATGLCTVAMPAADVDNVLGADGEFDIEARFIADGDISTMVAAIGTDAHLWKFDTPGGELSLRMGLGYHWTLMVNGVDRLATAATGTYASDGAWRDGDEVVVRVHVTPTTCRIRCRVNAAISDDARVGSLSLTLTAPTAGWLGSQGTTVGTSLQSRLTGFRTYTDHTSMLTALNGEEGATVVVLGDSTMAVYNGTDFYVAAAMATVAEARAGRRIGNLCRAGDAIAGQMTKWNASQYAGNTSVLAVIMQVGINDVAGASTVAQMTTAYQALISALRVGNAGLKIIAHLMLPADTYSLIDATDEQNWIDLNSCISGVAAGGGAAITGIDTIISAPSITANANGSVGPAGVNILRPEYEITPPDGVHPNRALREILAAADRAALISLGVW